LEMRRSRSSWSLSDAQSAASISRTVSVRAGWVRRFFSLQTKMQQNSGVS